MSGRAEARFVKIEWKISLIHQKMTWVGAGVIEFLGASSHCPQVLAAADTIAYYLLGARFTEL